MLHAHGMNNRFFFLWEKILLSNAKYSHSSCHTTWLPCKTSIVEEFSFDIYLVETFPLEVIISCQLIFDDLVFDYT